MALRRRRGTSNWLRIFGPRTPWVLMYHRFSETTRQRCIGADVFEEQLAYLRKYFIPMSLRDLVSKSAGGCVPSNAVAITIDDGYADFYVYAWPILRKYGVPATLYAVTEFVSQRIWLWPDEVRFIVENSTHRAPELSFQSRRFSLDLGSSAERERAWGDLADYCLTLPNDQRVQFIRLLACELDVDVPATPTEDFKAMTWQQLAELADAGIEIGAHTMTHPRLTSLPLPDAEREIIGSKIAIEEMLGTQVLSFCYPNGTSLDYDEHVKEIVRASGYRTATVSFQVDRGEFDAFAIGRIGASSSIREFRRSISRISRIRRLVKREVGAQCRRLRGRNRGAT